MWGTQIERQESKGLDIIIALDTSRSMLADDVPPTRLTAAKKAIVALIDKLQGDRIGLIAFAGSAFLVCPLTSDYSAFRQMLDETGINTIPRGGSDLGSILKEVSDGFGETGSRSRLLILVSDGEDHGVSTAAVAGRLRESGVVICCVTVGSDAGSIIPLPDGNFLKDREGNIVRSRTNPATLDLFSGRNVRLGTNSDTIVKLYEDVRPLLLQRSVTRSQKLQIERFQFPLAAAVLLLVLGPFLSIRKRI
jgi:Ca-activated chloride channel family protein